MNQIHRYHGLGLPLLSRGACLAATLLLALSLALAPAAATGAAAQEVHPPRSGSVVFPEGWPFTTSVTGRSGMVATTDHYATEVGVEVLRAGGNAVDAAVAVAFALAVVNPEAGNIGGGGFLVAHLADGTSLALDYREKAPMAATQDMFLDADGNVTDRSIVGHLANGVPGSVMGMWRAHQRLGSLPWAAVVEPAVELAGGFVVRPRLAESVAAYQERLRIFPATEAAFLPGGSPPAVGDTFRQPDLQATLRRIQRDGADGFYAGETADLIVAEMERGGGLITHEDLAAYDAVWREPIRFPYRGHTILSMPPVSSGGVTLALMANMLEAYDLSAMEWHSAEHVHLMAEVWRRAFADRNTYLADPAFVDVPVDRLTSPAYAAGRRADISMERATPSSEVGGGLASPEDGDHTTHFSVVDGAGNAVSVTTTINSLYGNRVTVAGAGFLLNNEMDDFTSRPGVPNQFGLVEGRANAVEPGKRMLSSMTPTIVLDPQGDLRMLTGSPGGPRIITSVFQSISNIVDFGMTLTQSVNAPRVHHQHQPDQIRFEAGGLTDSVKAGLRALGHDLDERAGYSGDVQAILVWPDGTLEGYSDPRRGGTARGY